MTLPHSASVRFRPTECHHPIPLAFVTDDPGASHRTIGIAEGRCKRWRCPGCGRRLRQLHSQLIEAAWPWQAERGNTFARFLTVTWPTDTGALIANREDCANTSAMFAALIQEIRRTHAIRVEYYVVKEPTKRGRLHVHALTFGPYLRKCRRTLPGVCQLGCDPPCSNPCHRADGCQATGARPCVQAIAHRLGLGWIDIRKVRNQRHAAAYIAKYLGKNHVGHTWPRHSRRASYSRRFAPTTIGRLNKEWSERAYQAGVEAGHIRPQPFRAPEHTRWRLLSDLIRGPPAVWLGWLPGQEWTLDLAAGTVRHLGTATKADAETGEIIEPPWIDLTETAWLRRMGRLIGLEAQLIAGPTWEADLANDAELRRIIFHQARRRARANARMPDIEALIATARHNAHTGRLLP
jgi:hypothetical protein